MARKPKPVEPVILRPQPPEILIAEGRDLEQFLPAPDVLRWIRETFLDEGGPLYNYDHEHLKEAEIGVLWTNAENARHQRSIVGTAELVNLKGARWERARQRYQLCSWFGELPHFVITLDAIYCVEADAASFCALVDHELYHCGVKRDEYGDPKLDPDGNPVWALRGHDVEQFIGVVERWGPEAAGASRLVAAAQRKPLIAPSQLALACGNCS